MVERDTAVYNTDAMRKVQSDNESAMKKQASAMQTTKAKYESDAAKLEAEAAKLETQAAAQDRIAATAMMMETYIDSMGEKRSRSVPDTARRSAARQSASQMRQAAAAKKQQAAALKAAAAALGAQISALNNTITATKRYIENIISIVQRTDLTYAQQMDAIGAETQAFIAKINGIYNSFSDTSLSTNNGSITGLLSSSNPHDNPLMGAGGPNNPHDQPGISEWRFWEDLTNKEITYLAACTALNALYGNISDKERKDIADELAKSYANNPKIVASMNAFGDGAYQMPVFPIEGNTVGTTYDYHGNALDFSASKGTPIVSATGGTVTQVDWGYADNYAVRGFKDTSGQTVYYEVDMNGNIKYNSNGNAIKGNPYGNSVRITTGDGATLIYAHMSYSDSPPVQKDDKVNSGEQIGTVGNTGNSVGNHLHFEARNTTNSVSDYLPKKGE